MLPAFGFAQLLARLQPAPLEKIRARQHAEVIRVRLAKGFKLKAFHLVGSHSRSTAIRHHSDADYFAVISRDDARWGGRYMSSSTVLDTVRDELRFRFPATDISRDGQAVVVRFSQTGVQVDVVPAIFDEFRPGTGPIFSIPDGRGDWLSTSPQAHNAYIRKADERSGGKLKRVAQLIKFWRECREPRIPLSSFHVEMVLADTRVSEGAKPYSRCVSEAFDIFAGRAGRAYRDPLGISGYIAAVRTGSQREVSVSALEWAADHASRAYDAELSRDFVEAVRQWDIVFNRSFPKRAA